MTPGRGSCVPLVASGQARAQAHPEAQESQPQGWDFLFYNTSVYKGFHDFKRFLIQQIPFFSETPDFSKINTFFNPNRLLLTYS